jgi:hypothetical protein
MAWMAFFEPEVSAPAVIEFLMLCPAAWLITHVTVILLGSVCTSKR